MRLTTKIKQTLMLYDLHWGMDEDGNIKVTGTHKTTETNFCVFGKTIGQVSQQMHKQFNNELKDKTKRHENIY